MKKTVCLLVCAAALFSTAAFSMQDMRILTKGYSFLPGKTVALKNPLIFSLKINCIMHTTGINNLEMLVKNKNVTVDGILVSQGQTHIKSISDGSKMKIAADGSAAVEITNLGEEIIDVDCSLG